MTNNQIARFLKICDDYSLHFLHWYEDPYFKSESPQNPTLQDFSFGFNMNDVFCYGADIEEVESNEDLDLLEGVCKEIEQINNTADKILVYPYFASVIYTAKKHKIMPTEHYLGNKNEKHKELLKLLEKAIKK